MQLCLHCAFFSPLLSVHFGTSQLVSSYCNYSECLANPHTERVTVPPLANVGTKIDMIFLAQQESEPASAAGKKLLFPIQLTPSGNSFANTAECDETKPLRQDEAIFHLRCGHVACEVAARCVSSQFIVGSIYAIAVERRSPASCAEISVIGKNLTIAQTPVFVERHLVRLEGILAAQRLGKEVRCEREIRAAGRIEAVGASIPEQPDAKGCEIRLKSDIGRNWKGAISI